MSIVALVGLLAFVQPKTPAGAQPEARSQVAADTVAARLMSDTARKVPMRPEQPFRIASVSKT